jgi:predicted nicotinamide N-methyase
MLQAGQRAQAVLSERQAFARIKSEPLRQALAWDTPDVVARYMTFRPKTAFWRRYFNVVRNAFVF